VHLRVGPPRFGKSCLTEMCATGHPPGDLRDGALRGRVRSHLARGRRVPDRSGLELAPSELEISPEPAGVDPATITLELGGAAGKPITGARVAIEADMSHAGMSPLFAGAKEAELDRYRARLEFQMAGVWVILLQMTLPGGKKRERQIDVRGVRSN